MTVNGRLSALRMIFGGLAAISLAACDGGNGTGTMSPPPPSAFGPNFSEIQANVFTPSCATSGCHTGAGAPQGLRLDEVNSYTLLFNVDSSEVPTVKRVAPGDPDNSYLIQKLDGTAASGAQMPFGNVPLPQSTINSIRQWITDGATDDRATSSNPIKVTSMAPLPGTTLTASPASVMLIFDRELNAPTVDLNTFLLEGSGGDGSFTEGNETAIAATGITTPAMTPMSATFDLTGIALPNDTYRVRQLGSGAMVVQDIDGNALDGEFSGSFPTGDGTAGGDFAATFIVQIGIIMGPTLDQIQASVFTPTCSVSGCHSGPMSGILPSGMGLTSANNSFASIVGVNSIQNPMLQRVAPGDPDNSYLTHKLEGTAPGTQMPLVGGPLDQAVIDEIREWITNGAVR